MSTAGTYRIGTRLRATRLVAAFVMLVATLVAVVGVAPARAAESFTYTFVFANATDDGPGEVVQGVANDKTSVVTLADGTELSMHLSCSDRFHLYDADWNPLARDGSNPDWGWGEKGDPTSGETDHVRLWDFHIVKQKDGNDPKDCGTPYSPGNPGIDIEKTPDSQVLVGGGVVWFTITVTNIGDVDLTGTATTDVQVPGCARDATAVEGLDSSLTGLVGSVLSPGESFMYTCADEISAGFTNVAGVSAMWNTVEVTDEDDAVVEVAEVDIDKSVLSDLPLIGGGVVEFEITVTNVGEVRVWSTRVVDNLTPACGRTAAEVKLLNNGKGNPVGAWLAVGESFTYQCADEIAEGFTNLAKVNARIEAGDWLTDKDTADVTVVDPSISITKSPENQVTSGVVMFTITVVNDGDLRLRDVSVSDALTPLCDRSAGEVRELLNGGGNEVGAWLAPGESFTYECADEVAESFTNTAVTSGETEGGIVVDDDDDADVTIAVV